MISATGRPCVYEYPSCPVSTSPSQRVNCTATGASRPIVSRRALRSSSVLSTPSTAIAGSPGIERIAKKTTIATKNAVSAVRTSRAPTNRTSRFLAIAL